METQRNRIRFEELLNYKSSGTMLEIGCGNGGFVELARTHFVVECIDISPDVIDTVNNIPHVKFHLADIETISLPQNRYDVVVLFNILEHLQNPPDVIGMIHSSLVKGGIVIGSVPNNFGVIGSLTTRVTNYVDKTHCSTFPIETWQDHFANHEFQEVNLFGEVTLTKDRSFYLSDGFWKHVSHNMVFVYQK